MRIESREWSSERPIDRPEGERARDLKVRSRANDGSGDCGPCRSATGWSPFGSLVLKLCLKRRAYASIDGAECDEALRFSAARLASSSLGRGEEFLKKERWGLSEEERRTEVRVRDAPTIADEETRPPALSEECPEPPAVVRCPDLKERVWCLQ